MTETKRTRILLVDDDEHVLLVVGDFLAAQGFEVRKAKSGREALGALKSEAPDLILLDVMMPDMDGGDVARAIREDKRRAAIPIVYLTAAVSEEEVIRSGGFIGGERFVSKLSDPQQLLAVITENVRAK